MPNLIKPIQFYDDIEVFPSDIYCPRLYDEVIVNNSIFSSLPRNSFWPIVFTFNELSSFLTRLFETSMST